MNMVPDKPNIRTCITAYLRKHNLPYPKQIHHYASDCRFVAEILKQIYPRLINLENYPKCNKIESKLKNWELLNSKVLKKLNLSQHYYTLEELAKGVPGAVECLIMHIIEHDDEVITDTPQVYEPKPSNKCKTNTLIAYVNVKRRINHTECTVKQKMIDYEYFKKQVDVLEETDQKLNKALQKIFHMEQLLLQKTEEIEELTNSLQYQFILK